MLHLNSLMKWPKLIEFQRTPAEIDEMFEKRVGLRKFKGYVTDVQQQIVPPNHERGRGNFAE